MGCGGSSSESVQKAIDEKDEGPAKAMYEGNLANFNEVDNWAKRPFMHVRIRNAGFVELNGKDHDGIRGKIAEWLTTNWKCQENTIFLEKAPVKLGMSAIVKGWAPRERPPHNMLCDKAYSTGDWALDVGSILVGEPGYWNLAQNNETFKSAGFEQMLTNTFGDQATPMWKPSLQECQTDIFTQKNNMAKLSASFINWMANDMGWDFVSSAMTNLGWIGQIREEGMMFRAPGPEGPKTKGDHVIITVRGRRRCLIDLEAGHLTHKLPPRGAVYFSGPDADGIIGKLEDYLKKDPWSGTKQEHNPELYDAEFELGDKTFQRGGYEGRTNMPLLCMNLTSFMVETGWTFSCMANGRYSYPGRTMACTMGKLNPDVSTMMPAIPYGGQFREYQLYFRKEKKEEKPVAAPPLILRFAIWRGPGTNKNNRDVPGVAEPPDNRKMEPQNLAHVELSGVKNGSNAEVEGDITSFMTSEDGWKMKDWFPCPHECKTDDGRRKADAPEDPPFVDKRWQCEPMTVFWGDEKDFMSTNINNRVIEVAEMLGKKGYALQSAYGNDIKSPNAQMIPPPPGETSLSRQLRERGIIFAKVPDAKVASAPLLIVELLIIPTSCGGGRLPDASLDDAHWNGVVHVTGKDTDGVHEKLSSFFVDKLKFEAMGKPAVKDYSQGYCDLKFDATKWLKVMECTTKFKRETSQNVKFDNAAYQDGRLCGESNISKYGVRVCDFLCDQVGGWELIQAEDANSTRDFNFQEGPQKRRWLMVWAKEFRMYFRKMA